MAKKLSLSVRSLVEFVLRSGDIDMRFTGGERMQDGARAHRRLQKAAPAGYTPEVTLKYSFEYRGFEILLEGRADGVIESGSGGVTVDEIKSTVRPLSSLSEGSNPVFWAQAECYAFMLARTRGLDEVTVRVTYCGAGENSDEGVRFFERVLSEGELTGIVHSLFDRYIVWAEYESDRAGRRDAAIKSLPFPFPEYRPGQRRLAEAVYRTIASGRCLLAQAPTGTGKTVSTLFPAVKAMGEGLTDRIFYLTSKTTAKAAAEDAVRRMSGLAPFFKTVVITAKDKTCPHPGAGCDPENCELAKGYYDRLGDALLTLLGAESLMTRDVIERFAAEHRLCPFELSLDLTEWCDLIICDYNYVFDPAVSLRRFFTGAPGSWTLLTDEAHDLVARSREMFSARLSKAPFLSASKLFREKSKPVAKEARAINRRFAAMKKECLASGAGFLISREEDRELLERLTAFTHSVERWFMRAHPKADPAADELLTLYFDCVAYLRAAGFASGRYGSGYAALIRADAHDAGCELRCLDASDFLASVLACARSTVFFSATLSPPAYFRDVLGAGGECGLVRLPSPFSPGNLCLMVDDRVSTKYRDRSAGIGEIASLILDFVRARAGNYIIYFPSYRYMLDVLGAFESICGEVRTAAQRPDMTEEERSAFLASFLPEPEGTYAAFCVLGGAFSEGIDLEGERLIGCAVVGVGLPQLGPEQDLIRDYYDRRNGMGFEYAYMYPGMNKVLQAAGRVIRSESDRGAVLLIDSRFTRSDYLSLFPDHWRHFRRIRGHGELSRELAEFWGAE